MAGVHSGWFMHGRPELKIKARGFCFSIFLIQIFTCTQLTLVSKDLKKRSILYSSCKRESQDELEVPRLLRLPSLQHLATEFYVLVSRCHCE